MNRILSVGLVGIALVAVALLLTINAGGQQAAGQPTTPPKASPQAEPRLQNVGPNDPELDHLTKLSIKEFDREIKVHRSTNLDATRKGIYFHQPLLALIPRPDKIKSKTADKYPVLIHAAYPLPDGTAVKLVFKVSLTTDGVRKAAAQAVQNADLEFLKKEGIRGDQIEVRKWPVQRMVVDCMVGDEPVGTTLTPSLLAVGDNLEFGLTLTKDRHDKLVRALKTDPELVRFSFAYTYANTQVEPASVELRASKTTAASISSVLDSQNNNNESMGLKEGTVSQATKDRIVREVVMSLSRTVRASGPRVLDALKGGTDQMASTLFPQLATELPLTGLSDEREKALAAYLAPLIQSVKDETARTDTTTNETSREDTEKQTIKMGTKAGAVLSGLSVDVKNDDEVELTKTEREKLTKLAGVTFTKTNDEKFFRPSTIKAFKLVEGWQTLQVDLKEFVILGVGRSEQYLEQTPITAEYRTDKIPAEFAVNPTSTGYYDGVPLGAMLPYFAAGNDPPKGYVWADGKAKWPTDQWVPIHLQGKPVPDMNGILMGGDFNMEYVGTLYNEGSLAVSASGLVIKDDEAQRWTRKSKVKVAEVELYKKKERDDGFEMVNSLDFHPVRVSVGRKEREAEIEYEDYSLKYKRAVEGTATISLAGPNRKLNPPNMRSRWIIKMQ